MSFLNPKDAVGTCLLSTRWKHLWKRLPTLTLCSSHFRTFKGFTNFATQILSLCDACVALRALDFESFGSVEPLLLERIVRSAVSHNVNSLNLTCHIHHIPPSLFSCLSLTSLTIWIPMYPQVIFPNSLNLPALTFLELRFFSFCGGNDGRVEPFSNFKRLNTLILHSSIVPDAPQPFCISSTMLLKLSIHPGHEYRTGYLKVELSTPNLCIFAFSGKHFMKFSESSLSSIKQVSIDIYEFKHAVETPLGQLNWLIEMIGIKSLTVTPRTLQALSLIPDILKLKLPSLCNLKSLRLNLLWYSLSASFWRDIKIELEGEKSWKENVKLRYIVKERLELKYAFILDEMIDFLLQNSPSAKVEIVSMK